MRKFAPALLVLLSLVLMASTGVAGFLDGSGVRVPEELAVKPRLLGIHHLSLKDGVDPADFERYVKDEWEPVISGRYPGMHLMVMKGERNADPGQYVLVYDIQSVYVRDWWVPRSGTPSEALNAIDEACGSACEAAWQGFQALAETTGWADWVELAHD
jgi:hypothetical protein